MSHHAVKIILAEPLTRAGFKPYGDAIGVEEELSSVKANQG
jgi:ureidoglycolate hydrolase